MSNGRLSNVLKERELLAAALASPTKRMEILYDLEAVHFTLPAHVSIFSALRSLVKEEKQVNIDTLIYELKERGLNESIKLVPQIVIQQPPGDFVDDAIKELKQFHFYNSLQLQCVDMLQVLKKEGSDKDQAVKRTFENLRKIFSGYGDRGFSTYKALSERLYSDPDRSLLEDVAKRREDHLNGTVPFSGHPTHWTDIDNLYDGWQKGHLVYIGARPGVGKSTFMLNQVLQQINLNDLRVGIFSLEMPADSIVKKLAFCHAKINWKDAEKGLMDRDALHRLYGSDKVLRSKTVIIDDTPNIPLNLLYARIKHWKDAFDIQIVFIDYIQLITYTDMTRSKYEQITEISKALKVMAKECEIPIVALAQLNRSAAKENSIPRISDLRDSGGLEQDADAIFLLHCPSLEDPYNKPGVLQVIVGKNRFGSTGQVDLCFQKNMGFIGNLAKMERNHESYKDD